jgi:hypothetical protein
MTVTALGSAVLASLFRHPSARSQSEAWLIIDVSSMFALSLPWF